MKVTIDKVVYQSYILPYVKITYDSWLNGDYELIIGWFNYQLVIGYTPKNKRTYVKKDDKIF